MPTRQRLFGTVRSVEGKAALEAIKRGKSSLWQSLTVETDPVALMMQDAVYRSSALLKKTTPITPEEKLDAFRIMGFEAVPKQIEIVRDTHPIRVVRAGRRSGKTTLAAHEAVAVMLKKPGSMGWVVAPDYELAFRCWEIIVAELDKLVARGLMRYKVKNNGMTNMRIVMDNGSTVEGKSCENAEDLQGVGLDWLVIDEIGIVLPFVFLEFLIPALSDRDGWAFLIGTPIGENWTEKEVRHQQRLADLAGKESDWSEHLFETWHNLKAFPGGRNDPKILRMERNMPFEEWMEQVCAQPQRSRYVTYKEFDDQVHLRTCPFNPDMPVQLSIDPSTGVNPYAVAVFQDYGDVIYQIDEYYRMSVLAQDVIADLATRPWWNNVEEAYVDDAWPQEKKFWQQHNDVRFWMRSAGKSHMIVDSIPVVRNWLRDPVQYNDHLAPVRSQIVEELYPGKKWPELDIEDQRLVNGRAEVRLSDNKTVLLDCARYFIDKSCLNTVDEFTGYSYRRRKRDDANPSEQPASHKDHLMDCALRGTLVTCLRGDVPIEDVIVGDLVWTRQGWKSVTDAWCQNRAAPVVEILASNGARLRVTPNHRIWVEGKGWTTADSLEYNDAILGIEETSCLLSKQLSSTILRSDVTQNHELFPISDITNHRDGIVSGELARCTKKSGRIVTDQFPRDASFITSMATGITTTPIISLPNPEANIPPTITRMSPHNASETIWHAFTTKRWPGIPPPKVALGTPNTRALSGKSASLMSASASSVNNLSSPSPREQTTDFARNAATSKIIVPLRVLDVRPAGIGEVYDLTVEDAHEFLAGGLLVSNCIRYYIFAKKKRWGMKRVSPTTYMPNA